MAFVIVLYAEQTYYHLWNLYILIQFEGSFSLTHFTFTKFIRTLSFSISFDELVTSYSILQFAKIPFDVPHPCILNLNMIHKIIYISRQ
jgi:hypothetical protein